MKKQLLAVAVSIFALGGAAFATQILETPTTSTTPISKPAVRPSLQKVLDKRPTLPTKTPTTPVKTPVKTTTGSVNTGNVSTGNITTGSVIKQVIQQNATDVQEYRTENGYIVRYLKKPTALADKKTQAANVEKAIKTLLAEQKAMRKAYEDAAKTTTLMTRAMWDSRSQVAVDTYKATLLPYIDASKMTEFEKFIIGRMNLLKGMFDKLETIRTVKSR